MLAKQRKVEVIRGIGKFVSPHELQIANTDMTPLSTVLSKGENAPGEGARKISFKQLHHRGRPRSHSACRACPTILASSIPPARSSWICRSACWSSAAASSVWKWRACTTRWARRSAWSSSPTDSSRVAIAIWCVRSRSASGKRYEKIMVETKVTKVEALKEGIRVTFEGEQAIEPQVYDKVLVAVGRSPNGKKIGAEAAGVVVNERGFIPVDKQMRTNVPHIFAIGDIAGQPMLAHKASHEGKLAAEVGARRQTFLRCARDPVGRLHRPGDRVGGSHGDRSEGQKHRVREGQLPVVGQCPLTHRSDGMTA